MLHPSGFNIWSSGQDHKGLQLDTAACIFNSNWNLIMFQLKTISSILKLVTDLIHSENISFGGYKKLTNKQ